MGYGETYRDDNVNRAQHDLTIAEMDFRQDRNEETLGELRRAAPVFADALEDDDIELTEEEQA